MPCHPDRVRRNYEAAIRIKIDREADGRWIVDIADLPGVLAYGDSVQEALDKAELLAFQVIAERFAELNK